MIIKVGGKLLDVVKARPEDFTDVHEEVLRTARYADGTLILEDPRWHASLLGRGEEKATFCICDHNRRVFVLEIIDERSYLNGRFVTGAYFGARRLHGLAGVALNPDSPYGLRFTGLVKLREYAHGYEWGRFQWRPDRRSPLDRLLTVVLHLLLGGRYERYRENYTDVHERNVVLEIRPWRERGVPMLVRDWNGRIQPVKVGLQPIDLR
jgi:hypothetical protein